MRIDSRVRCIGGLALFSTAIIGVAAFPAVPTGPTESAPAEVAVAVLSDSATDAADRPVRHRRRSADSIVGLAGAPVVASLGTSGPGADAEPEQEPAPVDSVVAVGPEAPSDRPAAYCPAPGSEFINSWGFSRSGGRRHQGVDMMAPHGAPVVAPVDGIVTSNTSRLGGIAFYLLGDNGDRYYGAHLQSLDRTGYVFAGTIIGTVGSSGNASRSGPHLHFEVHPGAGSAVNPYPFAALACSGGHAGNVPADPQPVMPSVTVEVPEPFAIESAVAAVEVLDDVRVGGESAALELRNVIIDTGR